MIQKKIPFDFVFDYLFPLEVSTKPMFGLYGVYVNDRILLMLRNRKDHAETNGVWIATSKEHHKSLKKELPALCSISILTTGMRDTEWQMIPMDAENFEEQVRHACELIKRGDPRISSKPRPVKK